MMLISKDWLWIFMPKQKMKMDVSKMIKEFIIIISFRPYLLTVWSSVEKRHIYYKSKILKSKTLYGKIEAVMTSILFSLSRKSIMNWSVCMNLPKGKNQSNPTRIQKNPIKSTDLRKKWIKNLIGDLHIRKKWKIFVNIVNRRMKSTNDY